LCFVAFSRIACQSVTVCAGVRACVCVPYLCLPLCLNAIYNYARQLEQLPVCACVRAGSLHIASTFQDHNYNYPTVVAVVAPTSELREQWQSNQKKKKVKKKIIEENYQQ